MWAKVYGVLYLLSAYSFAVAAGAFGFSSVICSGVLACSLTISMREHIAFGIALAVGYWLLDKIVAPVAVEWMKDTLRERRKKKPRKRTRRP
jgi:hypothetical protein